MNGEAVKGNMITGTEGDDEITCSRANAFRVINAGGGDDTIILIGEIGKNLVDGGPGNSGTVNGGDGNDVIDIIGGGASDASEQYAAAGGVGNDGDVDGGAGNDTITIEGGFGASHALSGLASGDGGAGNDGGVTGGTGDDKITVTGGKEGAAEVLGKPGVSNTKDGTIDGGPGANTCTLTPQGQGTVTNCS